jgi:hypothetical protein
MAIDTATKRRSVSGIPHHPLGVGITPDVTKPAGWRATAAWGYFGITPNPPVVGAAFVDLVTLGTKPSMGVTLEPTIGGRW